MKIKQVDIHNMTVAPAKRYLLQLFNQLECNIEEVVIIHGFNQGTVLKDFIENEFKHPKIQSKDASLNSGRTRIFIKNKMN